MDAVGGLRGLRVTRSLVIPAEELAWRFETSSGPGGQHANRAHTVAEVSFSVEDSAALSSYQRARLLSKLGPVVTARATEERSQTRNRDRALGRLRDAIAAALVVPRPRLATAPSAGARRRRLEQKRRRGELKRQRRTDPSE